MTVKDAGESERRSVMGRIGMKRSPHRASGAGFRRVAYRSIVANCPTPSGALLFRSHGMCTSPMGNICRAGVAQW
jgi:hypothetical protein